MTISSQNLALSQLQKKFKKMGDAEKLLKIKYLKTKNICDKVQKLNQKLNKEIKNKKIDHSDLGELKDYSTIQLEEHSSLAKEDQHRSRNKGGYKSPTSSFMSQISMSNPLLMTNGSRNQMGGQSFTDKLMQSQTFVDRNDSTILPKHEMDEDMKTERDEFKSFLEMKNSSPKKEKDSEEQEESIGCDINPLNDSPSKPKNYSLPSADNTSTNYTRSQIDPLGCTALTGGQYDNSIGDMSQTITSRTRPELFRSTPSDQLQI